MTPLCDLNASVRRAKIADALDAALRQIKEPTPTADIVRRVAQIVGAPKEAPLIARIVGELAHGHANARETGETFVKYGRTMRRRVWEPSLKKRSQGAAKISLDPAELQRRREAIAAHEAEDEWTVQPATYLEDE